MGGTTDIFELSLYIHLIFTPKKLCDCIQNKRGGATPPFELGIHFDLNYTTVKFVD